MSKEKRRKRSRSRSYERRASEDPRMENMQRQIDNLTNLVVELTRGMAKGKISPPIDAIDGQEVLGTPKDLEKGNSRDGINNIPIEQNLSSKTNKVTEEAEIIEIIDMEQAARKENLLELLGDDPTASKELSITFDVELQTRWLKWMEDGVPDEIKKNILEQYPRKTEFYTEAPKVNTEIVAVMTEIAKKRDQHFESTQNCTGSALSALGGAISMILNPPEEGVDERILLKYLCDTGKLLADVHHQQSVARKAFITPLMSKSMRPIIDAAKSDKWLYGEKFAEQVKEAKSIEKACSNLKPAEKPLEKNHSRNPGNSRRPPANYRQVGGSQRRPSIKFKQRSYAGKPQSQTQRQTKPK